MAYIRHYLIVLHTIFRYSYCCGCLGCSCRASVFCPLLFRSWSYSVYMLLYCFVLLLFCCVLSVTSFPERAHRLFFSYDRIYWFFFLLVDIQHTQCPRWSFILERYKLCGHPTTIQAGQLYQVDSSTTMPCHYMHTPAIPIHWKRENGKQRNTKM